MNILEQFHAISCFVFDMDGVLTDGSLLVLPDGVMARRMNIKDGYALQLAVKKGYRVLVISGGNSPEVKERLSKLGISEVWMQVADKAALLKQWQIENKVASTEILFMGDDIPDLEIMEIAGVKTCPADAAIDIKNKVDYLSIYRGGEGCVREVIEKVMKLRGDWDLGTGLKSQ